MQYKLFAKVLTKWLEDVANKSIDSQEMAFIKGRQIMDKVLIANEAIESKLR